MSQPGAGWRAGSQQKQIPGSATPRSRPSSFALAAGRRRTLDDIACRAGRRLGKLLQGGPVAERMRGSARLRGMRYLYTVLYWLSQRREELVRAR